MVLDKNDSFGDVFSQEWFVWVWFFTRMIHLRMILHENDSFEDGSGQEWFTWRWFFTNMIHVWTILHKGDSNVVTSSQGGFVCGRFFARMIHIWTSLHKDISFVEHFSQGRFGGLVLCGPATSPLVTGKFFFEFLMKVLTEVHCGILLGNPKFQVNTFIHYQDMEILKFSVFQQCNFIFQPIVFKFQIYSG